MRNRVLAIGPVVLGITLLGGCATKGQLRTALEQQRGELTAQMTAERDARVAADQQIEQSIAALRTDIQSLRTEFGARVTELEAGMRFALPVQFGFDQAEVEEEDRPALDRFAAVVQKHYPNALVTVEGFSDPAGSAAYNRRLSQRRADAVRDYLVARGLSADRLRTVGYGETRLVVPRAAADQSGAEVNRRVTFVVEGDAPMGASATEPTTEATSDATTELTAEPATGPATGGQR